MRTICLMIAASLSCCGTNSVKQQLPDLKSDLVSGELFDTPLEEDASETTYHNEDTGTALDIHIDNALETAQCTLVDSGHLMACNMKPNQCNTMRVTWVNSLEFELCLSTTTVHLSGCTENTRASIAISRKVRTLGEGPTAPVWSRKLYNAELWSESGLFLRSLTFVDNTDSDCPTYYPPYESCMEAYLTIDPTLKPLAECVGKEEWEYNTWLGGCLFSGGYVKADDSLWRVGVLVNLTPGKYEVRLVFCPFHDAYLCANSLDWFDECSENEGAGPWPYDAPLVPTQQYISIWFEVVD